MPWLVDEAPGIAARVGEPKTEASGVRAQPRAGGGRFKRFLEHGMRGLGEIEGAPGVVFAVARRGDDAERVLETLPPLEPPADERRLAVEITKARDHDEIETLGAGGGEKSPPRGGRLRKESHRTARGVLAACLEARGERHARETTRGDPRGGDLERRVQEADPLLFILGERGPGGGRRVGRAVGHGRLRGGARV